MQFADMFIVSSACFSYLFSFGQQKTSLVKYLEFYSEVKIETMSREHDKKLRSSDLVAEIELRLKPQLHVHKMISHCCRFEDIL